MLYLTKNIQDSLHILFSFSASSTNFLLPPEDQPTNLVNTATFVLEGTPPNPSQQLQQFSDNSAPDRAVLELVEVA